MERVSVYEVSLRDGLQNERGVIETDAKRELYLALEASGLTRIELTSFVSPKWIPQLADAEELMRAVTPRRGVRLSALVPNSKGLERALSVGFGEIAVFLSASETHNKKNVNKTVERTLSVFREIVPPALEAGLAVRAYVSTVGGCPYAGADGHGRAIGIGVKLGELGCYQVSLGDTIGVGTPYQTRDIARRALAALPVDKIAFHLHDTRGTALANILAGLDAGIRDFDASVAGLGGCPYAPGAAGNVATEDLVYMLDGMGIETGVDPGWRGRGAHRRSQAAGQSAPSRPVQDSLKIRAPRSRGG